MKAEQQRDLNHYLQLPYTVILRPDEDGLWIARIDELEGCVAHGDTQSEALTIIEEMKKAWIEDALEAGDPIPEPTHGETLPSGKWLQRVPRSLHKKLADLASKEQVSLNQLVTSLLAEAVGRKSEPQGISLPFDIWKSAKSALPPHLADNWEIHQPSAPAFISFVDALGFAKLQIGRNEMKLENRKNATKKELAYSA